MPALYIYGHRSFPTPIPGLSGYDCSVDDVFKGRSYPLVYEGVFLAAFLVCTVALVSIYARIWLETRRHIKYLKTHATFGTGLLDEVSSTTLSSQYDDTTFENMTDGASQTGSSRKSARKSRSRRKVSSHLRRKYQSESAKLQGRQRTAEPQMNKSVSFIGTRTPDTKDLQSYEYLELCNTNRQINDSNESNESGGKYHAVGNKNENTSSFERKVVNKRNDISKGSPKSYSLAPNDVETEDDSDSGMLSMDRKHADISDKVFSAKDVETCVDGRELACLENVNSSISSKSHYIHDNENLTANSSSLKNDRLSQRSPKSYRRRLFKSLSIGPHDKSAQSRYITEFSDSENLRGDSLYTEISSGQTPVKRQNNNKYSDRIQRKAASFSTNRLKDAHVDTSQSKETPENIVLRENELKYFMEKSDDKPSPSNNADKPCEEHECLSQQTAKQEKRETGNYALHNDSSSASAEALTNNVMQSNRVSFFTLPDNDLDPNDSKQSQGFPSSCSVRSRQLSKSSQSSLTAKRVRKALRATRTTIIAFAITIGFILSYLPHLILIILRSVKTDFEHHFDDASLIFYNIFMRSYFANNVINIFVYGTMNKEFRTEIWNVWKKIKCRKD